MEFLHRDDRAEDFGLDGLVVLLQACNHGWFKVKTCAFARFAACLDFGMGRQAADEARHMRHLTFVVEWAIQGFFVSRLAKAQGLGLCHQAFDKLIVHTGFYQHPRSGGTVLACVEKATDGDGFGCFVQIGIGKHNNRRFAAQFQMGFGQMGGSSGGHLQACAHRACDGY